MSSGVLQAALAYALWGLFPLYFRLVSAVGPLEIVLHRCLWSLAFVLVVLAVLRRWAWLGDVVRHPRTLATFALSALLLSANWVVYVWAVNNGRVIESSLGYFITPLVNVLLGYFVLKERPRRVQWCAIAIAGAGVLWLAVVAGSLPWVGLVLAGTFGTYGLIRKTAPLGALEGLALETLVLAPLAAGLLAWRTSQGHGDLGGGEPQHVAKHEDGALAGREAMKRGEERERYRLTGLVAGLRTGRAVDDPFEQRVGIRFEPAHLGHPRRRRQSV